MKFIFVLSQKLKKIKMPQRVKLEDMIQSGMHFGHSTREWNPRMAPYIYGERNGRHILDLVQTYYLLHKVLTFLEENAAQGKTFLFVSILAFLSLINSYKRCKTVGKLIWNRLGFL